MNSKFISAIKTSLTLQVEKLYFVVEVSTTKDNSFVDFDEALINISTIQVTEWAQIFNLSTELVELLVLAHEVGHLLQFVEGKNFCDEVMAWERAKDFIVLDEWKRGFEIVKSYALCSYLDKYEENTRFSSVEEAYSYYANKEWLRLRDIQTDILNF